MHTFAFFFKKKKISVRLWLRLKTSCSGQSEDIVQRDFIEDTKDVEGGNIPRGNESILLFFGAFLSVLK